MHSIYTVMAIGRYGGGVYASYAAHVIAAMQRACAS